MIKIFLYKVIFIIIISFLFIIAGCTPYEMVEKTYWTGNLNTDTLDMDIRAVFNTDKTMILYFESIIFDAYTKFEGDYVLNDDYSFTAEFEKNIDLAGDLDLLKDRIDIKISGTLDYQKGIGNGKAEYSIDYSGAPDTEEEGEWEMTKM